MNPSAIGWIKKLISILPESSFLEEDEYGFYTKLKYTGFIYGSNTTSICESINSIDYNEEDRCKINLISALYYLHKSQNSQDDFVHSVIDFYKITAEHKRSFLYDLFGEPKSDRLLEKIIHKRIHVDDNIITKNFNYFLINAFLFIDVIGYHHFLRAKASTKTYVNNFEATLETIVFSVLNAKKDKTEYDTNLIKLFEASVRNKNETISNQYADIAKRVAKPLEKFYIIDMVCMASWSDKYIEKEEYLYLNQLRQDLDIDSQIFINSVADITNFYLKNKDKIAFLSSKNLAQSFYDNSTSIVSRLIKRNSKRLLKELSQSKEAMLLLTQSTKRNLTDEEQKKIQNQLLDIFKSIPSLAIFLLPGGMLLLPLFVKFIPKLLPSAFDDNRIEDNK
jgi:hypothetical protein